MQNDNNIVISLIIPAYNIDKYLDDCLYSLYRQTYQKWEAIVVNDGSTDNTKKICENWAHKDSRIRIIHQENGGVSAARNNALKVVSGDIVGFLDGDDYLTDDALETIAKQFEDNTLDAVFTGHKRVDENKNILEVRLGVNRDNRTSQDAAYSTLINGRDSYLGVLWNKYFRRKCIYHSDGTPIKFDLAYKVGEDQIWLLYAVENTKKVKFIDNAVYCYMIRSGSAVHAKEWNASKESEIAARTELVRIVGEKYPEILFAASGKYRRCMKALYKFAFSVKNRNAIGLVSKYGLKCYSDVLKSRKIPVSTKLKETFWQLVFAVSALIFH